ncbi:AsnC family transcriptional regulator [Acinetobacter bereziniae]|uniref:Lrp/AsnC family transcriptional regulator n=1 Tax=Acinetobacter bereziniae TaxID=106648 RepID=UPI0022EA3DDF|nr:AsnC family transcriptional regulator [Acinetobacter bereziniae]MDA3439973.1 AsnC family transcriptional regulator [Acinetobacter bereziniae]
MLPNDPIDLKILKILKTDSRLSNKDIGQLVHRTGQAVGSRIARMQDEGTIQKYTIALNHPTTQFIRVMMQNNDFEKFEAFVTQFEAIESCYKVCGSACYMLVAHFDSQAINHFIEQLSEWGQYSVDSVVKTIEP